MDPQLDDGILTVKGVFGDLQEALEDLQTPTGQMGARQNKRVSLWW